MATSSAPLKSSIDRTSHATVWIVLSLLAVALATRAGLFGDPAIETDEQFYLLVADRMWHGALPYVDIWDRKPILLFLIYAALRPLSPDGIVAYQVGATLFATMTAFVIVLIARRFATLRGAWLAGIAYLLYLPVLRGDGGQSAVFYNLFLALGALEVLRADEAPDAGGLRKHALCSMLWAGLAIQVKYTAAIDGCAFGLWLIVLVRRSGASFTRIASQAGIWIAAALTPTVLAAGVYAAMGHGQAFVQANFTSIFLKHEPAGFSDLVFLKDSAVRLAPLLLVMVFSLPLLMRHRATGAPIFFLLLWTIFAIADFFSVGGYYFHYALPLLVPATIVCAPLLETSVAGPAAIAFFAYVCIQATGFPPTGSKQSDERSVSAMVEAARPYAARGCIYLNDGPPIVYLLTRSCLPTRYVFPGHLNEAAEADATHATEAMADLLAARPSAIFVADKPLVQPRNRVTAAMLDAALASGYQRIATLPDAVAGRQQVLYARKDLLPRPGMAH
ncbi:ArnT family glycosyltransferase [Methyloferula stellata]|uniref:ArnT family glycosyltransferase n=1 Tax=Methyloferula stellata TaxID=876270 RepID=UPI00036D5A60|nr:hypothetical protein [Methyloferula stellata]